MDLFEEVAKFRAGRRLWARLLAERYGITDPKALMFRFGVVCGGSSLTGAQPYNNVVRVSVENMAAVLGGAQSIFTCAYDEAFQIPTEFSAEVALRTQQIIAYESGVARTVDPLGGSYYVEWLTDRMEEEIRKVIEDLDRLRRRGEGDRGRLPADADRAARARSASEEGCRRGSGGRTRITSAAPARTTISARSSTQCRHRTTGLRAAARRARPRATRATSSVPRPAGEAAAATGENVMPYLVDCCHAYATVGEMVARLKAYWGEFREPVRL